MSKPELGEKLHVTAQLRMERSGVQTCEERSGGQACGESRATDWDEKYGLNGKSFCIFYSTGIQYLSDVWLCVGKVVVKRFQSSKVADGSRQSPA